MGKRCGGGASEHTVAPHASLEQLHHEVAHRGLHRQRGRRCLLHHRDLARPRARHRHPARRRRERGGRLAVEGLHQPAHGGSEGQGRRRLLAPLGLLRRHVAVESGNDAGQRRLHRQPRLNRSPPRDWPLPLRRVLPVEGVEDAGERRLHGHAGAEDAGQRRLHRHAGQRQQRGRPRARHWHRLQRLLDLGVQRLHQPAHRGAEGHRRGVARGRGRGSGRWSGHGRSARTLTIGHPPVACNPLRRAQANAMVKDADLRGLPLAFDLVHRRVAVDRHVALTAARLGTWWGHARHACRNTRAFATAR
mmetsp:Transcript_38065/g.65280  ORF Transcript_38065/g.65280 Transcript_38065/m.65280 type:complete len:305 (-) Transcript_38065:29-943(-)